MTSQTLIREGARTVAIDSVRQWRLEQLTTAGYPRSLAEVLSERAEVDLHVAVDLVRAGCPAELALEILL